MSKKKKSEEPLAVSVIIPCYNSVKTIEACLHSLFQQQTYFKYEIIVVDSSTDETPLIIQQKFPTVKLIHLDQQTYPGAGRNLGVREAQGEIIAFLDSDCVAAEDWLEKGMEAIRNGYSLVGGSVQNANPGWISWPDYFLTFNEFMPSMPRRKVQFMPTCNFFVTKKTFEEIGGFRGDLLAGEDTLFCYSAAQQYQLLFDPELQVRHTNRVTFRRLIQHHYLFGKHSASVRKEVFLPGKNLVQYPLLALFAPLVRVGRVSWRMLRYNKSSLPRYLTSFPLVLIGAVSWSYGFVKEAMKKNKTKKWLPV